MSALSEAAPSIWIGLAGAVGASLGSFGNVVAHRVPLGLSIVRPGSRCPSCKAPIPWWGNVPVLGWLFVRGRCQACGVHVSVRYPLVELVAGLLAVALWLQLGGAKLDGRALAQGELARVLVPWLLQTVFVVTLVVLTLIDLDWFLLPDVMTLPLALLGLLAAFASTRGPTPQAAALGALLGGVVPYLGMRLYAAATGRDGLGGGDWKLLLGVGAWLGARGLPFVVFAGALQGLLAALIFRRDFARATLPDLPGDAPGDAPNDAPDAAAAEASDDLPFRKLAVPFGPFLALAALEWLFFQKELVALWPR
ncbi:MAG: prepilin peptidase [Myxococcota bacterium]